PTQFKVEVEGVIYSKLPIGFHLTGLPEVMSQTFVFSFLVCRYINQSDEKKSILQKPLPMASLLAVAMFFLYTIISIIFAIAQNIHIDTKHAEIKNILQFVFPVIFAFAMTLITKPNLILRTIILYAGSAAIFIFYQGVILKDMNLIYDLITPLLPCLIYFWIGKLREKSYLESEKSDKIEA
ncbi:MAG: hypothetical protein K6A89_03800, partial [Treponema sp.]|nr:hypothetical protein [Treponema sp.]